MELFLSPIESLINHKVNDGIKFLTISLGNASSSPLKDGHTTEAASEFIFIH